MSKTDKALHDKCVAAIKRRTFKPYDFRWTRFYEANEELLYAGIRLDLAENELVICSTVIDKDSYSILTTRRLITFEQGKKYSGDIADAVDVNYGYFKGIDGADFTIGMIQLSDGTNLNYFIETGKASMIMIQGVRTLIRLYQ